MPPLPPNTGSSGISSLSRAIAIPVGPGGGRGGQDQEEEEDNDGVFPRHQSYGKQLDESPLAASLMLGTLLPCRRAQKRALLVVDVQPAYYNSPAIGKHFPHLRENVESLLARARCELPPAHIVHVRANYTFKLADNFRRLNPDKALPEDIHACDFAVSQVGERIVVKPSFDSFHDTQLQNYLRELEIEEIVVCGLLTSVCVLFSVQSAFARGFRCTMFTPACGDRSLDRHNNTIAMYSNYIFTVKEDLDSVFSTSSSIKEGSIL
jgi:nicotinamidase-related amidase